MLMLAGMLALVTVGLSLDFSGDSEPVSHDPDDDLPPGDGLPPFLPEPEVISDVSSDGEESGAEVAAGLSVDGTETADIMMGGEGDDLIDGRGGYDDLRGGLGDDTINAGDGDDWVQGDADFGPGGNDEIHGGAGNDSLAGQGGDDLIWGDEDDDTIFGGEGDDTLFGGAGNDWLSGNDGDDVLISGGGADDLDGGRGNDQLVGGDDPETVFLRGGDDDDTLMPGAGDFAEGQAGVDSFILRQVDGTVPVIGDFDANEDQIILHLPHGMADSAVVDVMKDDDDTLLITVNGEPIGRLLHGDDLKITDIGIQRLPN